MAVKIRVAEPEDAQGLLAIYAPFCEASTVSFEIAAPTAAQMAERLARIVPQYPWLVCEIDSRIAGYVYASAHRERAAYRWAVDVAVYVADDFRRRGVGRGLYTSLFTILRNQGYVKALAGITLPNAGSVGLHEALGFRPVATYRRIGYKLGRWLDVGWWELDLQPAAADPREPRPFAELRAHESMARMLAAGEPLVRSAPPS